MNFKPLTRKKNDKNLFLRHFYFANNCTINAKKKAKNLYLLYHFLFIRQLPLKDIVNDGDNSLQGVQLTETNHGPTTEKEMVSGFKL